MQRRGSFWPAFLVVFLICIVILTLSFVGKFNFLASFFEKETSVIQAATFKAYHKLPFVPDDEEIKKLKDANLELVSKITDYEKIRKDNLALLDQFQTAYPQSTLLLKADIIGAPSFIPGVSVPENFVLNKGVKDNLKPGMAVLIKNNLVGVVGKVSMNISLINTINNSSISFTAKTENGAAGVFKGGNVLTLDNILLAENIKVGELVLTKGDINDSGIGIPPDLVVGKITSVEKNPSDLFQKAKIESFVNFVDLSSIFIYTQNK